MKWTADQILRRVLQEGAQALWRDPTGTVQLAEVHVAPGWIGRRLSEIESAADVRVAFVTRFGEGVLPTPDTVFQEGDLLNVIVREKDTDQAIAVLAATPEENG